MKEKLESLGALHTHTHTDVLENKYDDERLCLVKIKRVELNRVRIKRESLKIANIKLEAERNDLNKNNAKVSAKRNRVNKGILELARESGITLIALIITIIVLLTLAGISISMLAGDNSIVKNAQKAKVETGKAEVEEKVQLAVMGAYDSKGNFSVEKLKAELNSLGVAYSEAGSEFLIEIPNGKQIMVSKTTGDIREGVHKIAYNYNGGEAIGVVPSDDTEYKEGENITIKFSPVTEREGFKFLGWATSAGATEAEFTSTGTNTITMEKRSITLYAVWTVNKYKITYDGNGGSTPTALEADYGASISMTETSTRTGGYKFDGWYSQASGGEKVDYKTMPLNGATVYAQWTYLLNTVGAEVTIGGEQFYVIEANPESSNANVKLLSKFNLNQEGTAQQNATYATTACKFSNSNYWNANSKDLNYDHADAIAYTKAKSYGLAKGGTGRLLTYDEATSLQSTMSDKLYGRNIGTTNNYLFYWLGTSHPSNGASGDVWGVAGDTEKLSGGKFSYDNFIGVRAVLEVSKSKIF